MARRRGLSAEDKALWSRVAATAVAMHPARKSAAPLPVDPKPTLLIQKPADPVTLPLTGGPAPARLGAGSTRIDLAPHPREALHNQPLRMDHKTHRQMTRGKVAPEARIDLHGMIQSEAHGFLLGFLIKAHERGLRHVLVITGKGTSLGSDGALKRAVPLWFSLPEFRPLISSYEAAARNHGGEGALYVRLARHSGEKR